MNLKLFLKSEYTSYPITLVVILKIILYYFKSKNETSRKEQGILVAVQVALALQRLHHGTTFETYDSQ